MKKAKKEEIQINLSNKLLYILLTVIILILIGVGVYAYSPEVFGHSFEEIGSPTDCQVGQFLKWDGTSWSCSNFG